MANRSKKRPDPYRSRAIQPDAEEQTASMCMPLPRERLKLPVFYEGRHIGWRIEGEEAITPVLPKKHKGRLFSSTY